MSNSLAHRIRAVRDRIALINTDTDRPSALQDGPDLRWACKELRLIADQLDMAEFPENLGMRKSHVRVNQDDLRGYLVENGPLDLETLASVFDIHVSTAKRKLDGLVFQRALDVERHHPDRTSVYYVPGQKP